MIKIAVCDDYKVFTDTVVEMIHRYPWKGEYEVYTFHAGMELMESVLQGRKYDILFMDLVLDENVNVETGALWAKSIKDMHPEMLVVYMSGYDYFYKDMVRAEPFDFFSKPIKEKDVHWVLNKAMQRLSIYSFHYTFNGELHTVNLQDVLCMYSDHRKVYIRMSDDSEEYFYAKLDDVEKEINEICDFFARPSKSYLLNMKFSGIINTNYAVVRDEKIKISRKYKESFLSYKEMRYYMSYFIRKKR